MKKEFESTVKFDKLNGKVVKVSMTTSTKILDAIKRALDKL